MQNLNNSNTRRHIRTFGGIDRVIIHLGVNDLKTLSPTKVVEELRGVLLNLAETSSAKIFFSLVLPVGINTGLNERIMEFNRLAIKLIDNLRDNVRLRRRLFTIFNNGFTKSYFQDVSHLYEQDRIHLIKGGTAKLCSYFKHALEYSYFPKARTVD